LAAANAALHAQARRYMDLFGITPADLVDRSYSDLLPPS